VTSEPVALNRQLTTYFLTLGEGLRKMPNLTITRIPAQDLLDAARTISQEDIMKSDWLSHWVSAATFLDWARKGLREDDLYGFSNAVSYAKRAVCCRIDLLIRYNHLVPYSRKEYPQKILALKDIGIDIPNLVYELVIGSRNKMEHDYRSPDKTEARHAVEIADLCVRALEAEHERLSIVAVNWNAMTASLFGNDQAKYHFHEFNHRPMLFIDVFEDPQHPAAKIIDPDNREVRMAELRSFADKQAIELALILRGNYSELTRHRHTEMRDPHFYEEVKKQAGF
jgi:hypothetical protein